MLCTKHQRSIGRNFLKLSSLQVLLWYLAFLLQKPGKEIIAVGDINEAYKITPYIILKNQARSHWWIQDWDGAGNYQSVPALIAEELEVYSKQVAIEQTSGEKEFGRQVSGGSSSVRTNYMICEKLVHLHVQCCWKLQATNGKFLLKNVMLIVAKFIISHQEKFYLMVN